MTTGTQSTISVMLALFIFGIGYNALVGWLEKNEHQHGYVSLLVAAGTGITLGGATVLIGPQAGLTVLACFGASGLPMIIGSIERYVRQRKADEERARELAKELLDEKQE